MRKDSLFSLESEPLFNDLVLYLRRNVYVGNDRPYLFSNINLVKMDTSNIIPTAKYVLKDNLERMNEVLNSEIDIFSMNRIHTLRSGYQICPPILEIWEDAPYNSNPVIVDGGHRIYLAKEYGCQINCIVISQPILYPLPVLPLSGWNEVSVYDQVPKDKRNYNPNIPDPLNPHKYYRLGLPGSSGPRGK